MKLGLLGQEQEATIARAGRGCRKGESAYATSILFHIALDVAEVMDK